MGLFLIILDQNDKMKAAGEAVHARRAADRTRPEQAAAEQNSLGPHNVTRPQSMSSDQL